MIENIPLEQIERNACAPQWPEDPQGIEEPASSIKAQGLIQAPVGRRVDGRVEVEVLDERKLSYSSYERLNDSSKGQLKKAEDCDSCEHRKLASGYDGGTNYICTKPSCFRAKKSAHPREYNKMVKAITEIHNARISRAVAANPGPGGSLDKPRDSSHMAREDKLKATADVLRNLAGFTLAQQRGVLSFAISIIEDTQHRFWRDKNLKVKKSTKG